MSLIYKHNAEDMAQIARIAHARNDRKEKKGVRSKKFDKTRSEYDTHYIGVFGELGILKGCGLEIDETAWLCGDQGIDCILPCGLSIQARYRAKRDWDYALNGDDLNEFRTDIGILGWPGKEKDSVEIVGWTTKAHFALLAHRDNFNYGDRLVLHYKKLIPIEKFLPLTQIDNRLLNIVPEVIASE
jgi:hypothetical protein